MCICSVYHTRSKNSSHSVHRKFHLSIRIEYDLPELFALVKIEFSDENKNMTKL